MKTRLAIALGIFSTLSVTGAAYSAGVEDEEAVDCVDLMRVDHTYVVDEQNILFYMRGRGIYLNRLSHPVPGLDPNQPIMYRTPIGQLCRLDTVTALERWGFGLTEGASGTLGKFMPVDKEQADALRKGEVAGI